MSAVVVLWVELRISSPGTQSHQKLSRGCRKKHGWKTHYEKAWHYSNNDARKLRRHELKFAILSPHRRCTEKMLCGSGGSASPNTTSSTERAEGASVEDDETCVVVTSWWLSRHRRSQLGTYRKFDFDDVMNSTTAIIEVPNFKNWWRHEFRYVMIFHTALRQVCRHHGTALK